MLVQERIGEIATYRVPLALRWSYALYMWFSPIASLGTFCKLRANATCGMHMTSFQILIIQSLGGVEYIAAVLVSTKVSLALHRG